MVATVLYTGLRISELLGLVWDDVDFAAGVIHVRAQLSRAHRGAPARRVAPKTPASVRDVPLVAQLARLLSAHRQRSRFARGADWVFATARGTPYGHRNVSRRCLGRAAQLAGLNDDGWPPLRFHDLRHTFASHLIIDLGLDPAQVSRILGHARITITLDIYTHLFEDARHARDIRTRMAASPFAGLLEPRQPPPAPRCSSSDDGRNSYRSSGVPPPPPPSGRPRSRVCRAAGSPPSVRIDRRRGAGGRADGPGDTVYQLRRASDRHVADIPGQEERCLYLVALRRPRVRLVVVTCLPVADEAVDYYLGLIPAAEDARSYPSAQPRGRLPAAARAEDPRAAELLARLRELVPDRRGAFIMPFNVRDHERDLALGFDVPIYGVDHRFARYGAQERLPWPVSRAPVSRTRRGRTAVQRRRARRAL